MIVRRRTKGGKSTMNDMYLKNRMEKLEYARLNWLEVQRKLISQEYQIELLRIKAAKYRACILENTGLAEKLDNQKKENENAYDGVAGATFRTLEDMHTAGFLTDREYEECKFI